MATGFASSRFPASAISDTSERLLGGVAILVPGRHSPAVTGAMPAVACPLHDVSLSGLQGWIKARVWSSKSLE